MDLEVIRPPPPSSTSKNFVKCCNCGCSCSLSIGGSSGTWFRSVKRKHDEFEQGTKFYIPGFDIVTNARVEIENECIALREMVSNQQKTIQDLTAELEEERNASSSAANEAMSMILRLQREKAEIQMEARQFKRFSEEKTSHDQQEILSLEDLLYKREQTIQSLSCEVQAYKHRMMSYGLTEAEAEGDLETPRTLCIPEGETPRNLGISENMGAFQFEFPAYDYPPLKVNGNVDPLECDDSYDIVDAEKYAFGETPRAQDMKNLEYRIYQMEKSSSSNKMDGKFPDSKNKFENVISGQSAEQPKHTKNRSNSFMGMRRETSPYFSAETPRLKSNNTFKKADYVVQPVENSNVRKMDYGPEFGDEVSDRVYTVDSVQNGMACNNAGELKSGAEYCKDYISNSNDALDRLDVSEPDIKNLYVRLHALEADRESMRQALISMRTEKAQLILLKEIAQQLYKDMSPERRRPVAKISLLRHFSFMSIFKWITSFIFWRNKACRSKYTFGLTANNVGLLMLLENSPHNRQWRCLTRTQL